MGRLVALVKTSSANPPINSIWIGSKGGVTVWNISALELGIKLQAIVTSWMQDLLLALSVRLLIWLSMSLRLRCRTKHCSCSGSSGGGAAHVIGLERRAYSLEFHLSRDGAEHNGFVEVAIVGTVALKGWKRRAKRT